MIYAYYRVSSADQNYNSQKLGVEEYCNRCGYHIDKEVVDDGISGTVKAKDRNLWKIVKDAQKAFENEVKLRGYTYLLWRSAKDAEAFVKSFKCGNVQTTGADVSAFTSTPPTLNAELKR